VSALRVAYPASFAGGYYAAYFQDSAGITVEVVAPDGG